MTDQQTVTTTDPVIGELREMVAMWATEVEARDAVIAELRAEIRRLEDRWNDPVAVLERAYQAIEQQYARRALAETPPA